MNLWLYVKFKNWVLRTTFNYINNTNSTFGFSLFVCLVLRTIYEIYRHLAELGGAAQAVPPPNLELESTRKPINRNGIKTLPEQMGRIARIERIF